MSPIEDRLSASMRMDVINGDILERGVLSNQIMEAITDLKKTGLLLTEALDALRKILNQGQMQYFSALTNKWKNCPSVRKTLR